MDFIKYLWEQVELYAPTVGVIISIIMFVWIIYLKVTKLKFLTIFEYYAARVLSMILLISEAAYISREWLNLSWFFITASLAILLVVSWALFYFIVIILTNANFKIGVIEKVSRKITDCYYHSQDEIQRFAILSFLVCSILWALPYFFIA